MDDQDPISELEDLATIRMTDAPSTVGELRNLLLDLPDETPLTQELTHEPPCITVWYDDKRKPLYVLVE